MNIEELDIFYKKKENRKKKVKHQISLNLIFEQY